MKSYTDIEQSKKLAEFLSLESADAFYVIGDEPVDIAVIYGFVTYKHLKEQVAYKRAVPCWSLAALLEVLPDRTCVYKKTYKNGLVKYQGVMEGNKELLLKDNPVDACYDMILKLHEQNLL